MHPRNPYKEARYDFKKLVKQCPSLRKHLIINPSDEKTIDFGIAVAVYELNRALLITDFDLKKYHLPHGYLIPPIPGRLDYLLYLQDFLSERFGINPNRRIRGLDIGTGANGIYCILGAQHLHWTMVGTECEAKAAAIAQKNIKYTKSLQENVEI